MQEEIEIVDDEQLFEMEIGKFYEMLNRQKGKKDLRKRKSQEYRTNDLQTNKDYEFEIAVPYSVLEYIEKLGLDFQLRTDYGSIKIIFSN
jgi:hypothetical protein